MYLCKYTHLILQHNQIFIIRRKVMTCVMTRSHLSYLTPDVFKQTVLLTLKQPLSVFSASFWRECVDPALCAGQALFPAVEWSVLKVTKRLVCADGEGCAGHSQCVSVEQRCVVVEGLQQPAYYVIHPCYEPQHPHWHVQRAKVEGRQELHVEVIVALIWWVVIAEIKLPTQPIGMFSQSTCC